MSIGKPQIPFTYDDYKQLPESRDRHELMDGDLYVTPAPTTRHQIVSKNLEFALERHVRAMGLGLVLHAPVDVVLGSRGTVTSTGSSTPRTSRLALSRSARRTTASPPPTAAAPH